MKIIIIKPGFNIVVEALWGIARNTRHTIAKIHIGGYRKIEEDEVKPVENHELFDHLFIP